MISVANFSKKYGEFQAVSDLSFEVAPGEIMGLVGPNGAGKTSTLRSLAGIIPPSSGVLTIDGHDLVQDPLQAKQALAWIPDTANLFESLTVWEHLEFTAQVYQVPQWKSRAEKVLAEFEMLERREKMADELSHGMRQKVSICSALLHEPKALILDEPLTGLDPRGIRSLFEALRERAQAGAAVVLSSHLLSQIESLCTRFLILSGGQRLLYGSKSELQQNLPSLRERDVSLEEIFFEATEGVESGS